MARTTIRRRFLVTSIASALIALVLFAAGSVCVALIDDGQADIQAGDTFNHEAAELVLGAMALALPLALIGAAITAYLISRRSARPLEAAIQAARETTAHDLRRTLPVPERDDELRDLVVALNGLFARLDDGFGALGRFAADASHELRTPLAVLATELEVALRHPRASEEWAATAEAALAELRRLSRLVEGLLTLARAGAEAPASRIRFPVVDCVDSVVAQLSATAERAGVSLAGPADEVADQIAGDPTMVETAIRNLVENAITAAPQGGRVRIGFQSSSREVVVVVDDDGPGLGADPEALFAPFRRGPARADRQARGPGIGLGLAIARRVALAHGGTLRGEPSPLGGARFALSVPRDVSF